MNKSLGFFYKVYGKLVLFYSSQTNYYELKKHMNNDMTFITVSS